VAARSAWSLGSPGRGIEKARAVADRPLTRDLAAAHVAPGVLLQKVDFNWRGAETEYRRAIALAPDDGAAKFWYGNQLASFSDVESAIGLTRQALATEHCGGRPVLVARQ
jgi:Tfp pilus assembly protein PilF